MSANRYQPHVLILLEDDANRQLVNGFLLEVDFVRKIQFEEAGGWGKVLDSFRSDHIETMRRYTQRYLILLIDFDSKKDRYGRATEVIPDDLKDRVFVLGAWSEPEDLGKAGLGSLETIGKTLARECREETDAIWGHDLLKHNAAELERLREYIRPILFQM